ncbi:MAG: serine/threonine-protein kinase, partial [Planctomycetota bacterium]
MDDHTEHPTYEEAATAGAPSDTPISAEEASAAVHASYAHPERVGGYEIVDVLGEGGFGLVYLAEQRDKVARRVALKVIKPGMDSKSVLTRFSAERQTLALMNHPGLAKVFDAGMTEDGRPYFVMELVHGDAINRFCDKKKLTIEDRLELFMQVCDAIQHAHMKGVIHRDLKPGNILVETPEGGPRVRVIDFGVAKALHTKPGEVLATEAGQVIGTPEFMSPEQARGSDAIDTRSDVYALGVVLYELLTGRLPFDSREMRETGPLGMIRFIEEVEPPKPSVTVTGKRKKASAESEIRELGEVNWKAAAEKRGLDEKKLHDRLKGDLDWIVMKCLAKDQERRYESPSALARDIKNYLDDRPVSAGPPSLRYQAGKFLKRNRVGVSAALLVLLALVLGFGTAVVGFVRASNEADRARLAEAEAERRADELAKTVEFQAATFSEVDIEQLGRFVGDRILSRLATDLQRSGVSAAESTEQLQPIKEALQLINLTDLGRDVINEGVFRRAVESLSTAFSDEPLVEASLRHTLAETCRELGLIDLALENVGRALDLRREHAGGEARSTLDSRDLRAMVLVSQSRTDEARAIVEETLEARERLFGPDDPDT